MKIVLLFSLFLCSFLLINYVKCVFPPDGCIPPSSACDCVGSCGTDCIPGTSIPKAAEPLLSCPYPGTYFPEGVEVKIQMSGGEHTNYFTIDHIGRSATLEISSCTRSLGGLPGEEDNKQHIPVIIVYDANQQNIIAAGTVCNVAIGASYCSYVYLNNPSSSFPNKILIAGYALTKNQLISNYNTEITPNQCGSGMLPSQSLYVKVLSNGAKCEVKSIECPLIGAFTQRFFPRSLSLPLVTVTMDPPNCQSSDAVDFTTTLANYNEIYCDAIGNYSYSVSVHNLQCRGEVRILSALYLFGFYYYEPLFVDYSDPSSAVCAFLNTGELCNVASSKMRPRIYTFSGCYHAWEIQDYYWYANSSTLELGKLYVYNVYAQDPSGNGAWTILQADLQGINILTLSPTKQPSNNNIYEINVFTTYTLKFAIYFDSDTSKSIYDTSQMDYYLVLVPSFINNVAGRIDEKMLDLFFVIGHGVTAGNIDDFVYITETISFMISENFGFENLETFSETYYIAVIACYSPNAYPEYGNSPHVPWYGYYKAVGFFYGEFNFLYEDEGYYLESIYPLNQYFQFDYPIPNPHRYFKWRPKRGGSFCGAEDLYISYANPIVKLDFQINTSD